MIDIFYTGDARYNPDVSVKNHQKFFDELRKISKYTIHNFTKQDLERPICPYEDPADHRDVPGQLHRRRGESAKIQIWDFMSSLRRTSNPIIIKMRTDLWFTDSSIIHLILQIEKLLVGENDVLFVGSDFLPNSSCAEYQLIDYAITHLNVVQDYLIVARRNKINNNMQQIIDFIDAYPKRPTANKFFKSIINDGSIYRTLYCHLWLIRRYWIEYPVDKGVFDDYFQSMTIADSSERHYAEEWSNQNL